MAKCLVTGGAGFIGSHLVDYLIEKGHEVVVIDNLIAGKRENLNSKAIFYDIDIREKHDEEGDNAPIKKVLIDEQIDIVFHLAAVSRTPWAIEDPIYTYGTNVVGSANVLEAARQTGVKKVVLASSNIVYAAQTPYKTSKLAMEQIARDYNDLYGLPTVCLRFSNVAGSKRQHEDNVLAALAKSKRENGYITITGDGEQTRNFTYVMDVCEALYRAAGLADYINNGEPILVEEIENATFSPGKVQVFNPNAIRGTEIDIMHPKAWSLNEIAKFFNCPVHYVEDRKGDIKHLKMGIGPEKAKELLGFEAKTDLSEYISLYTNI